jgi:uncharacterized protein YdbL (DUF1318 family)
MTLKLTILSALVSAVVAGMVGWTTNGWRLNLKIERMVSDHSSAIAQANKDALTKYQQMEKQKQEAINEANRLARRNADAARAAGLERDRLREQISASTYGLSTATLPSIRLYSTTLNTVFGECVAEVERLAQAADGHALDTRTLIQAWPR